MFVSSLRRRRFSESISFGISVWIIPERWKQFQSSYGIQHIPHITIASKLVHPLNEYVGKSYKFTFNPGWHQFPSTMDNNKTFRACGWYCNVQGINIQDAHMSVQYYDSLLSPMNPLPEAPPDGQWTGTTHLVDTRSNDPLEWNIIERLDSKLF
tara:strand:- start:104 stop:565 length:462 start_codon:yes stop_codon:yes gene_type:complete